MNSALFTRSEPERLPDGCTTSERVMPVTLRATLCETRDALHELRKAVFVRGHIGSMEEIDTLIGVAEDKAAHAIGDIDRAKLREPTPVAIASPAVPEDMLGHVPLPARLSELRDQGMGLSVYCGNARCGHLRSLDLDDLIVTYGTHYNFMSERRLASKLVCKRCRTIGGRLVVVSDKRPRY